MKGKQAAVGFIFVTVLIDIMGIGIIIPIVPELIQELTDFSNSKSAFYGGLLAATYAVMQLLFAPILGGLSDNYGRRTLLLISLFGLGLDYLVIVFAPTLAWLFVARIISGICGSSFTVANAYIADISEAKDRAKNFGMVGAAFGLGFIIGPTLGGVLGEFGTRVPFMVAAGITLLNWLYGYFMVPESLSAANKRSFSWRRANPIGTLKSISSNKVIVPLLISLFMIYVASHATQSNWSFYAKEKFAWTPLQIGLSLGFVQGFIVPRVVKRFGEIKAVYTGFAFNALGLTLFALISEPWMVYAVIVPFALGGLAGPSLQSIMAGQTEANAQGELQGGLTQIMTLTAIIGPPLMTGVFRYYTDPTNEVYFPGAPFILAAVLALLSILVAYRTLSVIVMKKLN
ncbi:MAG: TCR/Tet family MFS transporter [Croceimicrobium sp.]